MIEIDIFVSDEVAEIFPLDTGHLKEYAVRVLESSGVLECDVNIVFTDDVNMTALNKKFKTRDGSTDVLSFRLSEENSADIEGEVYVSLERAKEQSVEYDVPYIEEVVRLVTHGLLHLTGRTHDSDEKHKAMAGDTEKFVESYGEKI